MDRSEFLFTTRALKHNEAVLYMAEDIRTLFEVDLEKNEVSVACRIYGSVIYRSFFLFNNLIYLFPESRGDVCIYDASSGNIEKQAMPDGLLNKNEDNWSADYIYVGDTLLFYWASPIITSYCLADGKWKTYRSWLDEFHKTGMEFQGFGRNAFTYQRSVYFHISGTPYLVRLNLESDETELVKIEFRKDCSNVTRVIFKDDALWALIGMEDSVNICKVCAGEFREEKRISINGTDGHDSYLIEEFEGNVFLLPVTADKAYIIDFSRERCDEMAGLILKSKGELEGIKKYPFNYIYGFTVDKKWYLINVQCEILTVIDLEKQTVENHELFSDKKQIVNLMSEMMESNTFLENGIISLDCFVDFVENWGR